ncbi:resolvase domain protein [Listeria grayi FSL F6-1183]|uniref:Resolvase domain protein n=1 Tax=Listeria grayi FSL F6-1183 TaxID=1265827 RepID=A0A829R505_LISGR|nr:resolvase domain protein [Listeria grayi FSL F6-1183]
MNQNTQSIQALLHKQLQQFNPKQIDAVIRLMEEGNTVPFIARYRKEVTGSLDEVEIREIEEAYAYTTKLEGRKEEIIRLIEEQGKLTDSLQQEIQTATKQQTLEDIYRPYKVKKTHKSYYCQRKRIGIAGRLVADFPSRSSSTS